MAKQKNSAIKNILQQLILDAFAEQMQQNFNYKQIAAKLNVEDLVTRQLILEIIVEMAEKGTIKEIAKGKYQLKELQNHVLGKIDMAQNGSAYLIVEGMEEDIFISCQVNGKQTKANPLPRTINKEFSSFSLSLSK